MKIFVFTDNYLIYSRLKPVLQSYMPEELVFFCSEASKKQFHTEILAGNIIPLIIKNNIERLISFDIGFSCHSKQIFPSLLVNKVRCINIHPGFNPYNRGWYPQAFSLINKLPAGITIHEMDCEIDHGPIICQEKVDIYDWDTSLTIYQRLLDREIALFIHWLPIILSGEYSTALPLEEGNYNGKKEFSNMCEIDMQKNVTFKEAIDFLRALSHPPYFNAFYKSGSDKIFVRLEVKHDARVND